jgi:hypothetical protein
MPISNPEPPRSAAMLRAIDLSDKLESVLAEADGVAQLIALLACLGSRMENLRLPGKSPVSEFTRLIPMILRGMELANLQLEAEQRTAN